MSSKIIEKPGFSAAAGFSWNEYIKFRPIYPIAFWERIYNYHSQHGGSFGVSHDVGAGAGIAAQDLVTRFQKVIVSDPNDGYTDIAAGRLLNELGLNKEKFTFLKELGEESSVESGTVDLLVCCEAIHFMDIDLAMKEFARQVKSGGSIAISFYGRPAMLNNPHAQKAWDALFDIWARNFGGSADVLRRALQNGVTGLDNVPFSLDLWEAGARRIFTNTGGREEPFRMSTFDVNPFPSQVGEEDVRQYIEMDEDWMAEKDVQWLKGMFASYLPAVTNEETEILWQEMEEAISKGQKIMIAWPLVRLLATRR